MHDEEGTNDRSRPYSSLAARILIGALGGAFLGLLNLWFYGFDLGDLLAAIAAGATFGALIGALLPWVAWRYPGPERSTQIVIACSAAGCVAGIVWWLIAQPCTSIGSTALAVGVGAILGAVFALFG
jgi:hypothetical protein